MMFKKFYNLKTTDFTDLWSQIAQLILNSRNTNEQQVIYLRQVFS